MADKDCTYDIVVFGATGFTGKHVLEELLSTADEEPNRTLKCAAAGRSKASLEAVVQSLAGHHGTPGIIAGVNVTDYASVLAMARSTRLVINCVGPYRLYGEPVVQACVEAGTHYLDVCGEPEFMERMAFKYGGQAAAAGCQMASACGFDSIPADWGTVLAQRQFTAPAVPSIVEMYLTIKPGSLGYKIHYATWQSAVLGFASVQNLRALRAQAKASGKAGPAVKPAGPRPTAAAGMAWCKHPAVAAWHLPFPGADAAVVRRTQSALVDLGQPPVHFVARFTMSSRYYACVAAVVGGMMSFLARYAWGRALLLRYPGLFSYGLVTHAGPSLAQMGTTKTVTTLVAWGYSSSSLAAVSAVPDKEVVVTITAPDPGYKATAIFIVQAALTILSEPGHLPPPGIHTPGILLGSTRYQARLQHRGIDVNIVATRI